MSILHYLRLVLRSALFVCLLVLYVNHRLHGAPDVYDAIDSQLLIVSVIFSVFTAEMVLRFFPSALESPGSQKQFARNYIKSGSTDIRIQDNNGTVLVLLIWICLNAAFGALYLAGIFDDGIMLLISCAYSVCDMICILFFCPFQTWFLKNKCCSTCRIYNWDYAMIFTPLFFVMKPYPWGLLALSVALLARWEITFYLHPERFSDQTNAYLRCAGCTERLCAHKRQLRTLWRQVAEFSARREQRLRT